MVLTRDSLRSMLAGAPPCHETEQAMWDEHHKDVLVMWAENHAIVFMLSIIIVTWIVWYGILVTAGYAMSCDLCPVCSATLNTLFLTVEIVRSTSRLRVDFIVIHWS